MPVLSIKTNTHACDNQAEFLKQLSAMSANMLSKPESYVMVNIEFQQALIFAGTDAPAAYVELTSLGLPENRTADFSAEICKALNQTLGIEPARIYIAFLNPERHMFGWNSATF